MKLLPTDLDASTGSLVEPETVPWYVFWATKDLGKHTLTVLLTDLGLIEKTKFNVYLTNVGKQFFVDLQDKGLHIYKDKIPALNVMLLAYI